MSGQGQVVDAAIVDGTAHLNAMTSAFLASGGYREERRGANLLDGGVPFYDVYETSDGKHLSVGALEPQFYADAAGMLGLEDTAPGQGDLDRYDELPRPCSPTPSSSARRPSGSSCSRAPTPASPA